MQQRLFQTDIPQLCCIKSNCHARLCYLPPVLEFRKPSVSSIRAFDVGRLVQVSGTVTRTGKVSKMKGGGMKRI